uniref:Uncharacterized protein n=1 Tax=Taian Tombu tick virus 1 TaxID=2972342 RepID=A0A9E7V1Z2_9TOMB|nr:MAG: hypothetical protein [Taian Tombu tick virus 1]
MVKILAPMVTHVSLRTLVLHQANGSFMSPAPLAITLPTVPSFSVVVHFLIVIFTAFSIRERTLLVGRSTSGSVSLGAAAREQPPRGWESLPATMALIRVKDKNL